ncbi:O-acetyl-ADP-ribose deacetylase (regulator of RNase III), contains Macro domain [Marininema mesophilum]|uniref:O-acetyl-ADP-ribose deacetylase (Regulator of RNase III), contains Macro domain n=1 Tax=Marininema mesophilum TaxID=1048340 RepID=A0A1H2VFD4_9BACL|nr:macro domain-containing protein [Marininema mesophilum]SDW67002.1 O-acetyl-ADP-ribose deacetylase (regulator of RNase III), contains Macro domain [Marininema mesophilum]
MINIENTPLTQISTEAVINPINCTGWLEAGPMLTLRNAFPMNFIAYRRACRLRRIKVGEMYVVPLIPEGDGPQYIINFPLKRNRRPTRLDDIKHGLIDLVKTCEEWNIRSITIPALGYEPGGPPWEEIEQAIINAFLLSPEIDVHLIPPEKI